jgi:predicted DCC family thiol-disulfide oxidoreductase YuxK
MMTPKTVNIIYDGQCGFCIRSLRIVRALDLYHSFRFYDSHAPEAFTRFPELSGANVEDTMYAVVESEPIYAGFFAFRRLIWNSPLMWMLIPLFYFPGAAIFGARVYAWVARNRSKFGCQSNVCDLPSHHRG